MPLTRTWLLSFILAYNPKIECVITFVRVLIKRLSRVLSVPEYFFIDRWTFYILYLGQMTKRKYSVHMQIRTFTEVTLWISLEQRQWQLRAQWVSHTKCSLFLLSLSKDSMHLSVYNTLYSHALGYTLTDVALVCDANSIWVFAQRHNKRKITDGVDGKNT